MPFLIVAVMALSVWLMLRGRVIADVFESTAATRNPGGPYGHLYVRWGDAYGIDPFLLRAIAKRESSENPRAYRYEAWVKDRKVNGVLSPGPDASRGLMQILEFRAREMGFTGEASELFDPNVNVQFSTALFARELRRAGGSISVALSVYNAGWSDLRPNDAKRVGGPGSAFVNEEYVTDILKKRDILRVAA